MLIQYHKGGLYYGFNDQTGQLKAYPNLQSLKADFPNGIDRNAQDLPSGLDNPEVARNPNTWMTVVSFGSPAPTPTPAQNPPAGLQMPPGYPASNPAPTPAPTPTVPVPTNSSTNPVIDIPEELANDPFFKQLPAADQQTVAYYWKTLTGNNIKAVQAFNDAMDQAAKDADPYFKEKARILKDELTRVLTGADADLATKEATLARRKQQILDDLTYNKDQLTTEQSAELARQADKYNQELEKIRSDMADRGLSSSSIKTQADEQLNTENQDVIESTNRKYARELRTQQVGADRQVLDLLDQIQQLRTDTSQKKTTAVRNVEATLGTGELADVSGAAGLTAGGITGTIATEKANDIVARAKALLAQNYPQLS